MRQEAAVVSPETGRNFEKIFRFRCKIATETAIIFVDSSKKGTRMAFEVRQYISFFFCGQYRLDNWRKVGYIVAKIETKGGNSSLQTVLLLTIK